MVTWLEQRVGIVQGIERASLNGEVPGASPGRGTVLQHLINYLVFKIIFFTALNAMVRHDVVSH